MKQQLFAEPGIVTKLIFALSFIFINSFKKDFEILSTYFNEHLYDI